MINKRQLIGLLFVSASLACKPVKDAQSPENNGSDSGAFIAFGSCLKQWKPQPIWHAIGQLKPAAFVFLGDNMYADVGEYAAKAEPERIAEAYQDLANSTDFQQFAKQARMQNTHFLATWDDHDYGENDAGGAYPHRIASKRYFTRFFDINDLPSTAEEPGIYHRRMLSIENKQIQFILLDTRSFRSPLQKGGKTVGCPLVNMLPNQDRDATVLGEKQWQWLARILEEKADLRIIASSIQFIPTEHCFEKWANFPRERQRMLNLLSSTKASGVVFISGDRHLAEISVLKEGPVPYPLYEITASGLNSAMGPMSLARFEENTHRLFDDILLQNNFGVIHLLGEQLSLQIRNEQGEVEQNQVLQLDQLLFNK